MPMCDELPSRTCLLPTRLHYYSSRPVLRVLRYLPDSAALSKPLTRRDRVLPV